MEGGEPFQRLSGAGENGEQPESCICCPSCKAAPDWRMVLLLLLGLSYIVFLWQQKKKLWEMLSCGSCFMPATIQAGKHRWTGDAPLNFIAVTCHSKTPTAFHTHEAVSQAFQHIWAVPCSLLAQSSSASLWKSFQESRKPGHWTLLQRGWLRLAEKPTHLCTVITKLYWVLSKPIFLRLESYLFS